MSRLDSQSTPVTKQARSARYEIIVDKQRKNETWAGSRRCVSREINIVMLVSLSCHPAE
jgi:hypothetical protein